MIFNSFQYIIFLALVLILYWGLSARRLRAQNIVLLIASYIFYAAWDWRFLSLIFITSVVDYPIGRAIPHAEGRRKRLLLVGSLIFNLTILGFFKYFNFFIDSATALLTALNVTVNPFSLEVILPVGISFYTFQEIAYTVDVYRGKTQPEKSFLNFAVFTSFFPQLAAGPIERASRMLPQIENPRALTPDKVESGLILILIGMFKKLVIADVAASIIIPGIFVTPLDFSAGEVLRAVYLFALQIYGDFSGYSDIARGSARLMGFELVENFNQPYFSQSVTEFWRRWHISLSFWFRDYVYIPLSNALKNRLQQPLVLYAVASMLTMLLSGLWHGANLTFVLWGGLHGLYLIVARPFRQRRSSDQRAALIWVILRIVMTFHLVLFAWVLFRASFISAVPGIYRQMLIGYTQLISPAVLSLFAPVVLLYFAAFAIDVAQILTRDHAFTQRFPSAVRVCIYLTALLLMIFFTVKPYVPFIYFQF